MDVSAFQLLKNNARSNSNARLHDTPIISYGRVTRVIDIQTVICETIIQTSLSREVYTVTLLNLSSVLLEMNAYPKLGDTVLLLFLQRYDPRMFVQETVDNPNASGYNKFSGVGVLMSTVKGMADTVLRFSGEQGDSAVKITSQAKWLGTFNGSFAFAFCRAVYDSEDEQLINFVFGKGRPFLEQHFAKTERCYGFWKDSDNEWEELDAAVTEKYSYYAPITRDIQGTQTTSIGLSTDKDDKPVETEAAVRETIHGKSPVTRNIRSPQTYTIGIGNDESEDAEEQREAAINITMGEKADVSLTSKSGAAFQFDKAVSVKNGDSFGIESDGQLFIKSSGAAVLESGEKFTVKNSAQSLGAVLADFIQAVHDAITLGSPTTQTMNPATQAALQALKTRCEALLEK